MRESELQRAADTIAEGIVETLDMRLLKIAALDLRSLEVQVAEHNARAGLQLAVWYPEYFFASVRGGFRRG